MLCRTLIRSMVCGLLLAALQFAAAQGDAYKYFRMGNAGNVSPKTLSGFALMGGGKDQDAAFQWMCSKSGSGDFLVLRASGDDAYNDYVAHLCHQNSVATLIITSRQAAVDPKVAAIIRNAEALFIAGGDQGNYVRDWKGTPVQDAINELIRRGLPVGGTSAGLAVLGEFSYSALNDKNVKGNLDSSQTLANPYNERVTITRDFLKVNLLRRTITDTHFVKRDRLGRLLGFMARIAQDKMAGEVRGIGVDERSAALVEPNGTVIVVGTGSGAYFFKPARKPTVCAIGKALTYSEIAVYKVPPGATYNIKDWTGSGGNSYSLNVAAGVIHTTSTDGSLYADRASASATQ